MSQHVAVGILVSLILLVCGCASMTVGFPANGPVRWEDRGLGQIQQYAGTTVDLTRDFPEGLRYEYPILLSEAVAPGTVHIGLQAILSRLYGWGRGASPLTPPATPPKLKGGR